MTERRKVLFCDKCKEYTLHIVSGSGRKTSCEFCPPKEKKEKHA